MDRPEVRQVPEGSGEQGKMEKTGCKIIYGAPTILAAKGLMIMTMTVSPRDCVFGDWKGTWIKLQEVTRESQR